MQIYTFFYKHTINYRTFKNTRSCISKRYVIIILLLILNILDCDYHSQNFDSLKINYIEQKKLENHNLIELTKDKKNWKWLSLAPNISVSSSWDPFTRVYKPMLNFSISLHNISTYLQTNARNRIEREKLSIQLQEKLSNEIGSINGEILEIQKDSIALVFEEKNIKLLKELYTIKSKQYQQNQINLEDKINNEINLNNKINDFELRKLSYINRRKKLMEKLKKPIE